MKDFLLLPLYLLLFLNYYFITRYFGKAILSLPAPRGGIRIIKRHFNIRHFHYCRKMKLTDFFDNEDKWLPEYWD